MILRRAWQPPGWLFPCRLGGFALLGLAAAGCGKGDVGTQDQRLKTEMSRPREKKIPEISDRPATAKTMYAYARVLYSQQQDVGCDVLLSKLIKDHPPFRPAYLLQAEVRMRLRHVDDAILTLRAGLRLTPRDDVLMNNLGICFLMKSDCGSALWHFTKAAAMAPNNARYRSNMALALGLLGRGEESRSLYAMVLSPEDSEHNQSVLEYARGNYFGAAAAPPTPAPTTAPAAALPITVQEQTERETSTAAANRS